MHTKLFLTHVLTGLGLLLGVAAASGSDWPQHGGTNQRNMISGETNLPDLIEPGSADTPSKNIKWKASFDNVIRGVCVVADGKVYLTAPADNDDPKFPLPIRKDWKKSSLYCMDEQTGKRLWKFTSNEEQGGGTIGQFGMVTAPVVEKDRLYVFGGRNYVFCLTPNGLGAGNVGPITNEKNLLKIAPPYALEDNDADVVWMFAAKKYWPEIHYHNAYAFAPLVVGDYIYASTGNGAIIDMEYEDTTNPPRRNADVPTFMMLDKKTGKLIAHDEEFMARGMIHGSWGTPCVGIVNGKKQILFAGCDGVIYSFDPEPELRPGKPGVLKTIWTFDPNDWLSANRRFETFGAPVCVDDKVYAAVSDDWTHPKMPGILVCIDATQTGNITRKGFVWQYRDIGISCGTLAISKGLIYASDLNGRLHCIDKETGKAYWVFEQNGDFRANPVVADGKIYIGNKKGDFYILKEGKELEVLHHTRFDGEINGGCTIANGTVYVTAGNTLYAFEK